MCKTSHRLFECEKFKELSPNKRLEFVNTNSLCKKCLSKHGEKKCWLKKTCSNCKGQHNTLIHIKSDQHSASTTTKTNSKTTASHQVATNSELSECQSVATHHASESTRSCNVLLATAIVMVKSGYGTLEPLRALLDQGSRSHPSSRLKPHRNYVSKGEKQM